MTRGGAAGLVVLVLAIAGAVLLIAAEASTLREVEVAQASCEDLALRAGEKDACSETGGEQHGWALAFLAAFALVMAWGAGVGRSRPAAAALAVIGAVVLGIAVLGDLPEVGEEGAIGANYSQAEARAGPALALEIAGGALLVVAGLTRLLRPGRE